MWRSFAALPRLLFLTVMLLGSALITSASLGYFDFETLPPFVIEKLPVRFEALFLAALRIHVASAALAFPLCLISMLHFVQRRPSWHRRLGWLAGVSVLFALVPSGVVLAFDAKGGALVTAGFLLSALLVAAGMLVGIGAARRRDFIVHRRAMRHVVAQMSVAVTSRALILALDLAGVDPDVAYVLALWLPVLGSAAVAELISLPRRLSWKGTRRENSALVALLRPVRVRLVARAGR